MIAYMDGKAQKYTLQEAVDVHNAIVEILKSAKAIEEKPLPPLNENEIGELIKRKVALTSQFDTPLTPADKSIELTNINAKLKELKELQVAHLKSRIRAYDNEISRSFDPWNIEEVKGLKSATERKIELITTELQKL